MTTRHAPTLAAAGRALSAAWATPAKLALNEAVRDEWGRHTILRCDVDGGPPSAPSTVIVKEANEKNGRIDHEWGNLLFLNAIPKLEGHVPILHAAEAERQLLVIEDLGPWPILADLLHGDDRTAAEDALIAHERAFARLNAASIGRREEYEAAHRHVQRTTGRGPAEHGAIDMRPELLAGVIATAAAALGVELPPGVERELSEISATLMQPGAFAGFVHRDVCPANDLFTPTGPRLHDFEFSFFGHVLLDGANAPLRHLFCMNGGVRIPTPMQERMITAYREVLAKACPEATVDTVFAPALAAANAFWLTKLLRDAGAAVERERGYGPWKTHRQRILMSLEAFVERQESRRHTPALHAAAAHMLDAAEQAWPEVDRPLPGFAALSPTRPNPDFGPQCGLAE